MNTVPMSGPAPVSVAEIYRALATAPAGVRPHPVKSGSEEMRALPVHVYANAEGESVAVALPVSFWLLEPHRAKSEQKPERIGSLAFMVQIPEGYELRKKPAPVAELLTPATEEPPEPPAAVPWTQPDNGGRIPEFDGKDPEIFAFNPERLAEIQREANRKKPPGSGPEAP